MSLLFSRVQLSLKDGVYICYVYRYVYTVYLFVYLHNYNGSSQDLKTPYSCREDLSSLQPILFVRVQELICTIAYCFCAMLVSCSY